MNLNFEEYKKEVLIYNMSFNKFKQYYDDILNMKNDNKKQASDYARILSYATVTPIGSKYEAFMLKGYVESLRSLVQETLQSEEEQKVSRR